MFTKNKKNVLESQTRKDAEFVSLSPKCFEPDPNQPRKIFSEKALKELQKSMEMEGQLQPILVLPPKPGAEKYMIIAGERRWRAACASEKIDRLDAVVRCSEKYEYLKEDLQCALEEAGIEVALTDGLLTILSQISENKKRENLSILDEAIAYKVVLDELDGSLEQASKVLGLSKSLLSKHLSLIKADERVLGLSKKGHCQDVATLYTLNNVLKVDPIKGDSLVAQWQELVASGKNMRKLAEDSIREAKQKRRSLSESKDALICDISINKETSVYRLNIKQGNKRNCFSLPAKQFRLLRQQVMQYDIFLE